MALKAKTKAGKDDDKYVPSSGESDSDFDTKELEEDESKPNGIGAVGKTPFATEEPRQKEDGISKAVQKHDDPGTTSTSHKQIRYAMIMDHDVTPAQKRAKFFNFDNNTPFGRVEETKYVPCKVGDYVREESKCGSVPHSKFRLMSGKEKAAAGRSRVLCDCQVCKKRLKESLEEAVVRPGLRSGKKRTWDDKYGPGRTL